MLLLPNGGLQKSLVTISLLHICVYVYINICIPLLQRPTGVLSSLLLFDAFGLNNWSCAMEKDSYLHELYLHHALNSNGISSWGEEFVRSRLADNCLGFSFLLLLLL